VSTRTDCTLFHPHGELRHSEHKSVHSDCLTCMGGWEARKTGPIQLGATAGPPNGTHPARLQCVPQALRVHNTQDVVATVHKHSPDPPRAALSSVAQLERVRATHSGLEAGVQGLSPADSPIRVWGRVNVGMQRGRERGRGRSPTRSGSTVQAFKVGSSRGPHRSRRASNLKCSAVSTHTGTRR
jgi:hypothetical protein